MNELRFWIGVIFILAAAHVLSDHLLLSGFLAGLGLWQLYYALKPR